MYRSAAHVSVTYLAVECWALQNVISGLDRVALVGSRYTLVQNQFWDNFDGGVTQVPLSMHRMQSGCLDCL